MPVSIRTYREDDLVRLKEITIEAFEPVSIERNIESHVGSVNGRDWQWRKERHIDVDAQREPDGILVAELDGQLVGYVATWHDSDAGIGYIPNLAVCHLCRGQGLGRTLIESALDRFRSLGLKYARIETLEQNEIGQKLYPTLGFQEIARQIHYGMPLD